MVFNIFIIIATYFLGSYWCLGAFNCIARENLGMYMVQRDVTIALLFIVFLDEAVSTAAECGQADAKCNLLQTQIIHLGSIVQLTQPKDLLN